LNIKRMKLIDAAIGQIAISIINVPLHKNLSSVVTSLLLIRPGGIGDAALLAPTICSLKKNYPTIHITVLAEQRNAGLFLLIPGIDSLFCYDRPKELLQTLRCSYDAVIDTEQWHRLSAVVARLVRAPVKIGFDTNERRRMFTYSISYSHDDYEVDSFRRLLTPLGVDEDLSGREGAFLTIPASAMEKAAGLLESLDDKPFVVIFPGASIVERRWGAERYSLVANRLAVNGYRIVVVGGKEDRAAGEIIVGVGGLNLAGATTLVETAAVIARSCLVISGDSGVLHIAVGLDIPTVSLFGPGIAAKWAPRGDKHIVLSRQLPCSPCTKFGTTPPCPHDVRCMKEITADQVMEAAVRLLQKN